MGLKKFPKRGEIHLVCLNPTVGSEINKTRPALIISNDINNQISDTITVIPISSNTERVFPFEVILSPETSGLSKSSKVKCNQIRIVDKKRLIKSLGEIPYEKLKEVEVALRIHLGMYFDE